MEKKALALTKSFSSVVLYLEDIEELVSILEETGQTVIFSDEKYKYENMQEVITQSGPSISCLTMHVHNPHITVDIERAFFCGATIHFDSNSESDIGLYYRIEKVLAKRKRKLSILFNWYTCWIFFFLLVFGSSLLSFTPLNAIVPPLLQKVFLSAAFILTCFSGYFSSGRTTKIWLKSHKDRSNFFVRNKDSLLLIVLGGGIAIFLDKIYELLSALF